MGSRVDMIVAAVRCQPAMLTPAQQVATVPHARCPHIRCAGQRQRLAYPCSIVGPTGQGATGAARKAAQGGTYSAGGQAASVWRS